MQLSRAFSVLAKLLLRLQQGVLVTDVTSTPTQLSYFSTIAAHTRLQTLLAPLSPFFFPKSTIVMYGSLENQRSALSQQTTVQTPRPTLNLETLPKLHQIQIMVQVYKHDLSPNQAIAVTASS